MNKNVYILITFILVIAIAAQHMDNKEITRDRETLKKDIEKLNEINETLLLKIDSISAHIEEKQETIKLLEQKRNEVAVIYRDRIAAVDSLESDSVFAILKSRYLPR